MKLLGKDKHGFLYHSGPQGYIYQQYPTDRDYWVNGHNMRGEMNGWICSGPAWESTMYTILKEAGND